MTICNTAVRWLLTIVNDGTIETSKHDTEADAWEHLIREYRQSIDDWSDEDLDLDEVLGRVAAMYDEDEDAIREALAASGLNIKIEEL
ncbi:hypothetical protein [Mycolicibacterium sphagni]|uniref:hypothetical protein n=1 Tax=Mycolicibacterium sphagni TaxID=1786 RepID=UPI0021F39D3A|nr:hypothetical protein [Mycolicibacterium sphagni]MCV7174827.1 hypothetical protein [Mycolicibacterium sphagni]